MEREKLHGNADGVYETPKLPYNPLTAYLEDLTIFDAAGNEVLPTVGMAEFEYQTAIGGRWFKFEYAGEIDYANLTDYTPKVTGKVIRRIRITLSNFPANYTFNCSFVTMLQPDASDWYNRATNDYKPLLIENFIERNGKLGDQWEGAGFTPSADVEQLLIYTGDAWLIIKDFLIQIDGDGIQYQLFEDPVLNTQPDPSQLVPIYNMRKDVNTSPLFTIYSIPDSYVSNGGASTFTNPNNGTPKTPLITVLGSNEAGNSRTTPTSIVEGLERLLPPNRTFLLRRAKLSGAANQRSAFYATFYEGGLSTDID